MDRIEDRSQWKKTSIGKLSFFSSFLRKSMWVGFLSFAFLLYAKESADSVLPTVLASYPRSGNTWARYCLEYLTKRPAFFNGVRNLPLSRLPTFWDQSFYVINNDLDNPLCYTYLWFETDFNKPAIIKSHRLRYTDNAKIPIIFLLRDYKECIPRHNLSKHPWKALTEHIEKGGGYFKILRQFDLYKGKKILIYYDDLVSHPEVALLSILQFLNEPDDLLEDFLADITFHKNNCFQLYRSRGGSHSRGQDFRFHSKKLSSKRINQIDKKVMRHYPKLFEKYLKRYSSIGNRTS